MAGPGGVRESVRTSVTVARRVQKGIDHDSGSVGGWTFGPGRCGPQRHGLPTQSPRDATQPVLIGLDVVGQRVEGAAHALQFGHLANPSSRPAGVSA